MTTFKLLAALVLSASAAIATAQTTDTALQDFITRQQNAAPAPLFARTGFLAQARIRSARLAPDGKHVAYLINAEANVELHVLDTTTLATSLLLSSPTLQDSEWMADSKTLSLNLGATIGTLSLDNPRMPGYLAALKPAEGEYYVGLDRSQAGGILVVRGEGDNMHVLQRIDLVGNTTEIFRTSDRIRTAFLSDDGQRAFAQLTSAMQHRIVQITNAEEDVLVTCNVIEDCDPVSYDADSNELYILTDADSDLRQLEAVALADHSRRVVHSDAANRVIVDRVAVTSGKPRVVQYHDGTARNHGLDAQTNAQLAVITAHFPASNITAAVSTDSSTWLLLEEASTLSEARHHLYDSTTQGFREILASDRKANTPASADLSVIQPLQYRASDGMLIHGYVTSPRGVPLNTTPLVAVIHGGPWGRINSNYSGITQLLVNRGYSVFEPNFRASTGYGLQYMTAGNREFGKGVVQQDIIDGVHYLLAQGIGDAERLAIVGGSFGGFSVLNGLVFTPDLFKVGIASVPPAAFGSSMVKLLNKPGELERDPSMKEMMKILAANVDDPADIQRLYDISPQAHLAAIKAPLLIMAGADDDRVDINHVKQYSLQLFNQGKTLSLLIDEDAGHGYGSERAKHADIYLTELYLSHYLGGALEPLEDPLVAHYIKRRMLMNSNTAVNVNQGAQLVGR